MAFYRVSGITRETTTLVIPSIGVELDTGKVNIQKLARNRKLNFFVRFSSRDSYTEMKLSIS